MAKKNNVTFTRNAPVPPATYQSTTNVATASAPKCQNTPSVAAAKPSAVCSNPPVMKRTPSKEEVAQRAYFIYLQDGCKHGRDLEHWLKAEAQLAQCSK